MSVQETKAYQAECNNCGDTQALSKDRDAVIQRVVDYGWTKCGDVLHCETCPVLCNDDLVNRSYCLECKK